MYSLRNWYLFMLVGLQVTAVGQLRAETELRKDCATLSQPGQYPDYEPLPKYSIEFRDHDASNLKTLVLQISVSPEALGGSAIIRVACQLAANFPKETAIYALILDDRKAAQKLRLGYTDQTHYGLYLWHLRGRYELNRETHEQVLELLVPDVMDGLLTVRKLKYWLSAATSDNQRNP